MRKGSKEDSLERKKRKILGYIECIHRKVESLKALAPQIKISFLFRDI